MARITRTIHFHIPKIPWHIVFRQISATHLVSQKSASLYYLCTVTSCTAYKALKLARRYYVWETTNCVWMGVYSTVQRRRLPEEGREAWVWAGAVRKWSLVKVDMSDESLTIDRRNGRWGMLWFGNCIKLWWNIQQQYHLKRRGQNGFVPCNSSQS